MGKELEPPDTDGYKDEAAFLLLLVESERR